MRSTPPWLMMCWLGLVACGSSTKSGPDDGAPASGDEANESGGAASEAGDEFPVEGDGDGDGDGGSATSGDLTTGADDGQVDGDDEGGFVSMPDGGVGNECDVRTQDCPEGQKCTAWANDGGSVWNATRCVEESGAGVGGDDCMVEGSGVSGIDDCGKGFICLNTDEQNLGSCIEFCQGTDEDCDPGQVCAIYNDGVLPICLVGCDPLAQDCPDGQACIDTPNQQFICFTDASGAGGADGEVCPPEDGENSCDPGLWCGPGSSACEGVNCCTPYCEVGASDCSTPDECIPFYGDSPPPGFEDVGVCVLP